MLQTHILKQVQRANKKILLVTKYWDTKMTVSILIEAQSSFWECIFGLWENRIEHIWEKNLPRKNIHFIGNIQSQKIPEIVNHCSHIHSLASFKHAQKIENQKLEVYAFIQIRLDEQKDIWIWEEELWLFLDACKSFKNLKIIWISGMGSWNVPDEEKRKEFQKLIALRNLHMPNWLISAGTSQDYEIALQEWIDIIRVWKALV